MHHGLLAALASVGPAVALSVVLVSAILFGCGKKKKKADDEKPKGTNIRAPAAKDGVAGTYDPNYQTLNAVGPGDCFGADKANAPKAPANQNGVAGTYDPNYQTLNAVGPGDCFNKNGPPPGSSPGSPAPTPTPPAQGGIAGTHDPNYQTLAGMDGNVFDKK
uniref:Lipoprotein n=1 Tax=Panagrellus redivivus TaxID=6233 RepID=A0A7E4UQP5_PANRE